MIKSILFMLFLFFIFGCSKTSISYSKVSDYQNTKTSILIKRFKEYWNARVNGNFMRTWEYELPYQKYLTSFEQYKGVTRGYKGKEVSLHKIVKVTDNEAILERGVKEGNKVQIKKDKWFYIKDNWYHKFYQSILPPKNIEEAEFQ